MVCVQASLARASSAGEATAALAAPDHSSSTHRWHQPCIVGRLAVDSPPQQQQRRRRQVEGGLSLEVIEEQDVPDMGRFTAYADGRVRVLFADRTILSLDAGWVQARLIMPDGSRQEVSVSRPLGVEEYVQVGLRVLLLRERRVLSSQSVVVVVGRGFVVDTTAGMRVQCLAAQECCDGRQRLVLWAPCWTAAGSATCFGVF